MDRFAWDVSYDSGLQAVDQQHRFLFKKADELSHLFHDSDGTVTSLLIRSIIDCFVYHMEFEGVVIRDRSQDSHMERMTAKWRINEVWDRRGQMTQDELFEAVANSIVEHVQGAHRHPTGYTA